MYLFYSFYKLKPKPKQTNKKKTFTAYKIIVYFMLDFLLVFLT